MKAFKSLGASEVARGVVQVDADVHRLVREAGAQQRIELLGPFGLVALEALSQLGAREAAVQV